MTPHRVSKKEENSSYALLTTGLSGLSQCVFHGGYNLLQIQDRPFAGAIDEEQ